jgi:hypothetical protein
LFNDQPFDRLPANPDDPERPASAAELAAMEFAPQADLSSLNAEEWSKIERGLRTSLAFASVFVKLTKTEFVTMLGRMVAVDGADAIETANAIETIVRDLDSAKRQCQGLADLLDAAKARLLSSVAVVELGAARTRLRSSAPRAPYSLSRAVKASSSLTRDFRPLTHN